MKLFKNFITACFIVLVTSLVPAVLFISSASAQLNSPKQPACNPAIQSCQPASPPTKECDIRACMSAADRAAHEKANDCVFLAEGCKGMDLKNQCCSKDEATGKSKPVDKQATKEDSKFDWTAYQKQCLGMKQSNSLSDGLWAQCVVGKPHDPKDDEWNVKEVISNGGARSYCIDGCSTPQKGIDYAIKLRVFLANNKDNPTGHPNSSFYEACKAHDICYQSCTTTSQATCDANLRDSSLARCNDVPAGHTTLVPDLIGSGSSPVNTRAKCITAANMMHEILSPFGSDSVGGGGGSAFKKRRQQMCQCC
jgi:hypothetical protein